MLAEAARRTARVGEGWAQQLPRLRFSRGQLGDVDARQSHLDEFTGGFTQDPELSSRTMLSHRSVIAVAAIACASIACGPGSKRAVPNPPREVTYDDTCGLQTYFDERASVGLPPPVAADESLATTEKARPSARAPTS